MKGVTPELSDCCPQVPSPFKECYQEERSTTYPEGPSFSLDSTNSWPIFIFSHSSLRVLILRGFTFPRFGLSFFSFYNEKKQKSLNKHFPKFFIKIPPSFMDIYPREDLPRQHTVTIEFTELLGLEWPRGHLIQTTSWAQTHFLNPILKHLYPLPLWVLHSCFSAAPIVRQLVNSYLLFVMPQRSVKREEK